MNQKPTAIFVRELYIWFDKARKPEQSPAIENYLLPTETVIFEKIVLGNFIKGNTKIIQKDRREFTMILKNLRNKILNAEDNYFVKQRLNPV